MLMFTTILLVGYSLRDSNTFILEIYFTLTIIGYNKTVNIDSPKGTIEGKRTLKENGIEMTISLKDISIKYKEVEENENTEAEQKGLIISFDHFAMQTLSIARSA